MAKVRIYEVDVQSMSGKCNCYFGESLSQALDFADPSFHSMRIHSYVVSKHVIDDIRETCTRYNQEVYGNG